MLKYILKVLIPLTIVFLVSCAPKGISPVPKDIMADLDEVRSLTKTELADNQKIQNDYKLKQKLLKKLVLKMWQRKKNCLRKKGLWKRLKRNCHN